MSSYHAQSSITSTNKEDYLQMELLLLQFFDWNIARPTAAHFLGYFLTQAAVAAGQPGQSLRTDNPDPRSEFTNVYMQKYTNYFLEISLQGRCYVILSFLVFEASHENIKFLYKSNKPFVS